MYRDTDTTMLDIDTLKDEAKGKGKVDRTCQVLIGKRRCINKQDLDFITGGSNYAQGGWEQGGGWVRYGWGRG